MKKRNFIIGLIAIFLIGLMIMKLMANKKAVEQKIYIHDTEAAILVETSKPETHTFESAYSYLGTFEPVRQNTIGSDAQGKIIQLNIEEGQRVSKGQVLAKIDDELLRLQLENAEVSLESQQNDETRNVNLAKERAIAGVQLEKTKFGVKSAEIQKKQLQRQIKNTVLTAPFSGVITKKMIDLGSVISQSSPIVEITDISSLKLTVNVPERDILKFSLNQSVRITSDLYSSRVFEGKVSNIAVQADKSHNFKVQVTVSNQKQELKAGMYGAVTISNNKSVSVLSIPRKALVGSSKNPQVFVVRDGKAVLTSFNAGTADGAFIEVVEGLTKADQIVIKGQINLQDNTKVKTNPK